jgi:hypothetical protein
MQKLKNKEEEFEDLHTHIKPNINRRFICPACTAIENNLQPSEDGFYRFE